MSKFKVGDKIILSRPDRSDIEYGFEKDQIFTIEIVSDNFIYINRRCGFFPRQIDLYLDYESSNRYKLKQAIEKRDYRLRNFMIVFLILVIILAVYFFYSLIQNRYISCVA